MDNSTKYDINHSTRRQDLPLPTRVFYCRKCHVPVSICPHCDRGHQYCRNCAAEARKKRTARARRKYRSTAHGKRMRKEAEKRRRKARKKDPNKNSVGDRTSLQRSQRCMSIFEYAYSSELEGESSSTCAPESNEQAVNSAIAEEKTSQWQRVHGTERVKMTIMIPPGAKHPRERPAIAIVQCIHVKDYINSNTQVEFSNAPSMDQCATQGSLGSFPLGGHLEAHYQEQVCHFCGRVCSSFNRTGGQNWRKIQKHWDKNRKEHYDNKRRRK